MFQRFPDENLETGFTRSSPRIIFDRITQSTIEPKNRDEVQIDDPMAAMDRHARGWATPQKRLSELFGARAGLIFGLLNHRGQSSLGNTSPWRE